MNLPPTFFGIFKDGTLGVDTPEWADEFGTALRGRGKGPAPGFFRSVFDEV